MLDADIAVESTSLDRLDELRGRADGEWNRFTTAQCCSTIAGKAYFLKLVSHRTWRNFSSLSLTFLPDQYKCGRLVDLHGQTTTVDE
ncbi:hypothetical protein T07_5072 [Trichinella nelsoni]|uniref:Uncharacterized protein n=1 Tax=Trichinella nelsoni TaxID=6336 RepID=A0A0V0S3J9_9BILA|nr:hypothetical protein T07_5072 [Trichinella nelsoni]